MSEAWMVSRPAGG